MVEYMIKEQLKEILMSEDVVKSINNNIDELLTIIPEIRDMMGFEHKNPQHHLDVWEHTLLSLSFSPVDFKLRLILLLHDIGKPHSCQDGEIRHFKGHQIASSEIAEKILTRLKFNKEEIEEMCYLIKKHDTLITQNAIEDNKQLALMRFKIQVCDGLSHNPLMLEKRIEYLLKINDNINEGEERKKYWEQITSIKNAPKSKKH